jgi:hypothetical protein
MLLGSIDFVKGVVEEYNCGVGYSGSGGGGG